MKVALIQTNPIIGDFAGNIKKMSRWLDRAKKEGCDLGVFPELAISGYPPMDLLERPSFLASHQQAFNAFLRGTAGIGVLCGTIERHTASIGKPLHNSAVLFEDGQIIAAVQKRLLPAYDVFDETRYFEPGQTSRSFSYKGLRLGLTICEDIWNDKNFSSRRIYAANPLEDLIAGPGPRPDLLINIAASPFHIHKTAIKHEIFAAICARYQVPLFYVNQVGGQDSLLFDGFSQALDRSGRIIASAKKFEEDMIVLDNSSGSFQAARQTVPSTEDETADVFAALVMGTRDYVTKCGFGKVVLGLSGGIDSALTAVLASQALGAENVLGVALPSPYSSSHSIEDAQILAKNLGIGFEIIPITAIFEIQLATLAPVFKGQQPDITEQNLQARIRGALLMALANKFGALLLSTGNKSEMAVGYCTLYGDMNGGLAVISDVPKQLVYRLAAYANRHREIIPVRTIEKAPSAELAPNQRDQDDLPPYEVLDAILSAYLEENKGVGEIIDMGFAPEVVKDVVRRIRKNEYKRKQAPLGLKVTTKAFGYGRRYPTAENFQEETWPGLGT